MSKVEVIRRLKGRSFKTDVDISTIQIAGIDTKDYPDFCDAYVEYAEWKDGTELTEDELVEYQDESYGLVNELIHDEQLYL